MKAKVVVVLKGGVLDPAGKAVETSLHRLGFDDVTDVRLGRYIELEVDDTPDAQSRIDDMCRQLLSNTVIEDYRIEMVKPQ